MSLLRAVKLLSIIKGLVKNDFGQVSETMGQMHGLPQKLGQHFTLYRAEGFNEYFHSLCTESKVEDIAIEQVLGDLGIETTDYQIKAQASIGQVYKVRSAGRDLAVKVKYPGVQKKIRADLKTLQRVAWPTRFLPLKNNSLIPLLNRLEKMLLEECDYLAEAKNQKAFFELFEKNDSVTVPSPVAFNDRAIASCWCEGKDLRDAGNSDKWFVEAYLSFTLNSLKELGKVHTDPHPGNFLIAGEGKARRLVVLDFGSVVSFTTEELPAIKRLLTGAYESESELVEDLRLLGVAEDSLTEYSPIIGDLISILMEPFYHIGEYPFANWRMQYKLNTLMASRAWEKPLDVPLKLIMLFRAIQGLYFYARESSVTLNWNQRAKNYLG